MRARGLLFARLLRAALADDETRIADNGVVVIGGHMRRSLVGGLLVVVATSLPLLASPASAVAASPSRAVDRKAAGGAEGLRHSCG